MTPDRCPACADLAAPCCACFARDVTRLCDEMQPAFDACRVADEIAEALRPKPVAVTTAGADPETARALADEALRALGLDDASLDAAWLGTLAAIRAEGGDPDVILRRAGEVLTAWRDNPYALATEAPR